MNRRRGPLLTLLAVAGLALALLNINVSEEAAAAPAQPAVEPVPPAVPAEAAISRFDRALRHEHVSTILLGLPGRRHAAL